MSHMPELRPGPPWAMEEMIAAEPGLVEPVLASAEARALGAWVAAAVTAREPVVVTGCGTSEHAAMAAAAGLCEALGTGAATARDAFEAALDPQLGGVTIAISHEAETMATLAAAAAAAKRDASVALVTARPERAPEDALVVATPLVDRSWCHTVGYVSPLLALQAVAAAATGETPHPGAARDAITSAMGSREALRAAAAHLAGCDRVLAVGSGVDEITARELALKIEEACHVPVTPLGLEKLLHGHLPACDDRTGAVLLRLDPHAAPSRDARALDALRALSEIGLRVVLVGSMIEGAEALATSVTLPVPSAPADPARPAPRASALLSGAVAAQLLTLELAMALGTNPDLIRREEAPYRAAAAAAEARSA